MKITSVKKHTHPAGGGCLVCEIDGDNIFVPENLENIHYAEIKRLVDEGELTIGTFTPDPVDE